MPEESAPLSPHCACHHSRSTLEEETMLSRRKLLQTTAASAALLATRSLPAFAANAPGVTDKEIKIGQTMPYSGPASAYGTIGKAELAYFKKINDEGGINGRKINLLSFDDGYSPPKTVEQVRRLVEQEQVAFIFQSLGTPPNSAIHKYLNDHKVPQLFVATGATKWADPEHFPWTMGWQPNYQTEGRIYAKYLLANKPAAKIAILYQNDDYGKDYVVGLKAGLGAKATSMIVKEISYEVTDPTVDSQVVSLQASGADTFLNVTTPKFAAQAIRKAYDIGWKPLHLLNNVSISVSAVLQPAGLEKSTGLISAAYTKDPTDPKWKDDKAFQDWLAWMKKYLPDGNVGDSFNVYGYSVAQTLAQVLKQCGNDLSRENVMKQAASIKDLALPMLLPGIKVNTSASNFSPITSMQLERFNGTIWELFGDVLTG
jgi:branched-chain amino acid transport system substrate-binding protein